MDEDKLGFLGVSDKFLEFNLHTRIRVGNGISNNLDEYLYEFNFENAGVIVDKNVSIDLTRVGKVYCYDEGEPTYDILDSVKKFFMHNDISGDIDCVVGIGGGSVMDVAKGVAFLMNNKGRSIIYRGFPKNTNKPLPVITIPSTIGSSSEVSYCAVFNNPKDKLKRGINVMDNFPFLTIYDPVLTLGCPKSVLFSSCIDGLVHSVEGFSCNNSNPISRVFSREGFQLLFDNLFDYKKDVDVHMNLMLGSFFSGIGLLNSGSGIAGVLSSPTSPLFGIPHGISGGILLPYMVEWNINHGYSYIGLTGLNDFVFRNRIRMLCNRLGIPRDFKGYGITRKNVVPWLYQIDMRGVGLAQNPVPFSTVDGRRMVRGLVGD